MFEEKYRREMETLGPDAGQMERLLTAMEQPKGAKKRRRPGRAILAAAVICTLLVVSAVALSPTLQDVLYQLMGSFGPYAQTVEQGVAVDQGIQVKVVRALADEDQIRMYLEVTDLTGDRLGPDSSLLGLEVAFRAYEEKTKTGLAVLNYGYLGMETPEEMKLRYQAVCVGESRRFSEIYLPAEFSLREARPITQAERDENPNSWFSKGKTVLVLEPGQTPMPLGTDLFTLSSMGFDENGVLHVQLALADGMDARSEGIGTLYLSQAGKRVGHVQSVVQFTQDGQVYADLRLEFSNIEIGPEDADTLAIGPLHGTLHTAAPILGNWELAFHVEKVTHWSVPCRQYLEEGPATMEKLTLSLLGLKVEGSTPPERTDSLNLTASLLLKNGTTVDLGTKSGSWTWEDGGIGTADRSSLEAYEADIKNGIGYFENRFDYEDPIEPEQVEAVVINGQKILLGDGG